MPELNCTARRVGDLESRTEEYELYYTIADAAAETAETAEAAPRVLRVKYQAARAFEINAALDEAVERAREAISAAGLEARPADGALSQLAWRAVQSAKYEGGEPSTKSLDL